MDSYLYQKQQYKIFTGSSPLDNKSSPSISKVLARYKTFASNGKLSAYLVKHCLCVSLVFARNTPHKVV